ncbi:hypothetical protein COLO4_34368 [Corchorus olitorius]|uniref:Uncharacterized protein n=1 Tax=Corchorus olitorius TaxID=93759 RepID=A0A1R3GL65_9ROSI|nr:hypothetical protein COLO4_34368 [Corchorus olitorius]
MSTLLDALSLNLSSVSQDQAHNFIYLAFTESRFPFPISNYSRPMRLVFESRVCFGENEDDLSIGGRELFF